MGRKRFLISNAFLGKMVEEGGARAASFAGVPKGARVAHVYPEHGMDAIAVVMEHPDWSDPAEGAHMELISVNTTVYTAPEGDMLWAEVRRALESCFPDRAEVMLAELVRRTCGTVAS